MDKAKLKKFAIKTGLDAAGILGCVIAAGHAPDLIPMFKGLEMPLAVAAGIWLYVPLRGLIDKAADKIKK